MPTPVKDDTLVEPSAEEQDQFLRAIAEDIEVSQDELVEVSVNVTKACEEDGRYAIEVRYPINGGQHALSFEQARQLSQDLTTAGVFVRNLRMDRGWDR